MASHNEKGMQYNFNCMFPDGEATIGNPSRRVVHL